MDIKTAYEEARVAISSITFPSESLTLKVIRQKSPKLYRNPGITTENPELGEAVTGLIRAEVNLAEDMFVAAKYGPDTVFEEASVGSYITNQDIPSLKEAYQKMGIFISDSLFQRDINLIKEQAEQLAGRNK